MIFTLQLTGLAVKKKFQQNMEIYYRMMEDQRHRNSFK